MSSIKCFWVVISLFFQIFFSKIKKRKEKTIEKFSRVKMTMETSSLYCVFVSVSTREGEKSVAENRSKVNSLNFILSHPHFMNTTQSKLNYFIQQLIYSGLTVKYCQKFIHLMRFIQRSFTRFTSQLLSSSLLFSLTGCYADMFLTIQRANENEMEVEKLERREG